MKGIINKHENIFCIEFDETKYTEDGLDYQSNDTRGYTYYSDDYVKWLEHQLRIHNVIKLVCSCGRREINVLSGICDICWNEKGPDEQTVL